MGPNEFLFVIAFGVFLILACFSWRQPRAILTLSRWAEPVPAGDETPDGFYTTLYNALKDRLEERQLPFSAVGFGPKHLFSTRTIFGSRPVYLAIRYQHLTYYVYAAPAPGGLFVSSWLFSKYRLWEGHPILQWVLLWKLYQQTLFQFDVTDMFHSIAHNTLMDVVNDYREEQGLAPLEEHERRPVLHSFYATMKQGTASANGYVLPVNTTGSQSPSAPIGVPLPVEPPVPSATSHDGDSDS